VQCWTVVHEYVDRATGKHSDREQFRAMFAAASRREFDAVVTWAPDRLSREGVAQTFEHIKTLLGYGVQYISYSEAHFRTTGPAGELMIAIAAWIAQQERVRLSERTKAGLERARRQGRVGGRRPLVLDRERIARMDREGFSMREIAAEIGTCAASVCRIPKLTTALPHREPYDIWLNVDRACHAGVRSFPRFGPTLWVARSASMVAWVSLCLIDPPVSLIPCSTYVGR
jgi:DNA invertase Pin-like site-specific DNA recombinase